jgi:undecaprenyl phosphate-alpha-L-ara4N flippase subunit ArnE
LSFALIGLVIGSALTTAVSNTLLRIALKDNFAWKGSIPILLWDLIGLLRNPIFLLGMLFFITANILWLLVVGAQKLSLAYPLQLGLVLGLNAIISVFVFHEALSIMGWLGVGMVSVGILLIVQ